MIMPAYPCHVVCFNSQLDAGNSYLPSQVGRSNLEDCRLRAFAKLSGEDWGYVILSPTSSFPQDLQPCPSVTGFSPYIRLFLVFLLTGRSKDIDLRKAG
jgi:hypothetical protein